MQNLIVAFNAVAPLFLLIAAGFAIRRFGLLRDEALPQVNRLAFTVFLPALLFSNLYETDVGSAFSPRLLAFAVIAVLAMYAGVTLFVRLVEKDNKSRGAMIQAIYRSNFVLLGVPVVQSVFAGQDSGVTAVLVAVIVPLFNVLAVVTLEMYRGGSVKWKKVAVGIVKNPLIIGSVLGLVFMLAGVRLPEFLRSGIGSLAGAATPVALVVLGASIHLESVGANARNIVICVLGRLVAVPLVCITAAVLCGFRGIELGSLLAMLASPTAVSSFTMAQQMDSDAELTAGAVVFSSGFACLTLFLWIFLLKQMGFM